MTATGQAFADCLRLRELSGQQTLTQDDRREMQAVADRLHALAARVAELAKSWTALSDALAAAQSRAVAALGKQYVGGQLDGDALRIALDSIGCTDPADTEQWIAALDVIRETGASLPRENGNGTKQDEAATAGTYTPDDFVVPF